MHPIRAVSNLFAGRIRTLHRTGDLCLALEVLDKLGEGVHVNYSDNVALGVSDREVDPEYVRGRLQRQFAFPKTITACSVDHTAYSGLGGKVEHYLDVRRRWFLDDFRGYFSTDTATINFTVPKTP